MGMSSGGGGGMSSEINVTPMIDILLVLLIIFMVIQPTAVHGLDTLVPQPPKNKNQPEPNNDRTIVVQVLSNNGGKPAYKINDSDFAKEGLLPKLQEIYSTRAEKVMFVKGDKDLDFQYVAEIIGLGKEAGVDNVGIITPRVEAGQ
ncbi:ExbD/TolR family protein [Terriglobus tenax]|uniref:ExbD/TolR family protein n=1 Tax=Terriglobus tenax TaxID=1111115 RepID=UPI0021E0DA29|nr:biopolymer transporter ExbD [Terriglobus tenax]